MDKKWDTVIPAEMKRLFVKWDIYVPLVTKGLMRHCSSLIHVDQSTNFLDAFLHKPFSELVPRWRTLLLKSYNIEYSYTLKFIFERVQDERVGTYAIRYNSNWVTVGSTGGIGWSSLAQVCKAPASRNDAFEPDVFGRRQTSWVPSCGPRLLVRVFHFNILWSTSVRQTNCHRILAKVCIFFFVLW
jgi:hypothetical protein